MRARRTVDWVSWYADFATSPEVLGYYPKSKFAKDLQTMPWYKVITMPGFRLGRTNPSQDPGGVLAAKALEQTATAQNLPALKTLATETSDEYAEDPEEADIQTGQLDGAFMYEADANSQGSPFVKLTGTNLAGDYTITLVNKAPHMAAAEAFIKFLLGPTGQAEMKADQFNIVSPATVDRVRRPERSREHPQVVTPGRAPRLLRWLGALLVLYLAYPVGAFVYRIIGGHSEGWNVPGLWSALWVSVEGATISVLIGVVAGIPLAYVLAHRRGWLSSAVGVVVQLPLAVPPLISGILLIYIVGPYSFLGQLSGERLTQTIYGVVIAQSFVSRRSWSWWPAAPSVLSTRPWPTSPPPSATVRWPGSSVSTCPLRRTASGPG